VPSAVELRELEDDELETRLVEYRRELLNLRFQLATGQLDNYSRLAQARHNVARVLAILRDREIALAEGRQAGPVFIERPVRPPRRRPGEDEATDADQTEQFDEQGPVEAEGDDDDAVDEDAVDDDTAAGEDEAGEDEADEDEADEEDQ